MTSILVTGGTGTLGRALVPRLREAGHVVRVLSRRRPPPSAEPGTWATGDLRRTEGLAGAVSETEVIIHCAGLTRGGEAATRNLVGAAQGTGVRHVVFISIVGVDQVPLGYYRAKLAAEQVIAGSPLGWTILRSTQFHEMILRACELLARPPVVAVPAGVSFQPVAAAEVADRLAALAGGAPSGRVPDLGGPRIQAAADLARAYLDASGRHRRVVPVRVPGRGFAGYRAGGQLTPGRRDGTITFEEFLATRHETREQR